MSGFMNEASWDRIARVVLGIVLIALGFSGAVEGGLGTFLGLFGFVPLITGLVGWCPLYAIFRFRTNRETARV
jgi:predicted PurR-regulated permease PerM